MLTITANSEQRTANSEQRTANSEQRTANSEQRTANKRYSLIFLFLLLAACETPGSETTKSAKAEITEWDVSKILGATYTKIGNSIIIAVPWGTKIDPLDVDLPSVNTTATLETKNLTFTKATAKDFIVKAQDGSTKTYKVTVTVIPGITAFRFNANDTVNIDHSKGEITVGLKYTLNKTNITKLTATTLTLSSGVSIESGLDPRKQEADYSQTYKNPQKVTITAADGITTQTYKIKVQITVSDGNRFYVVYGEIKRLGGKDDAEYSVDLNHLDMSAVSNLEDLFHVDNSDDNDNPLPNVNYAYYFNGNISEWDVSKVTNMKELFGGDQKFAYFNSNINDWDVSKVTNMKTMFYNLRAFNQPLNKWTVSNVKNMSFMFSETQKFNQDLSGWTVSKVTNMFGMFYNAKTFNKPLNGWDVSNVKNMSFMFKYAKVFNQDLSGWSTDKVTDCKDFSQGAKAYTNKARKPQKQAGSANCQAKGLDW